MSSERPKGPEEKGLWRRLKDVWKGTPELPIRPYQEEEPTAPPDEAYDAWASRDPHAQDAKKRKELEERAKERDLNPDTSRFVQETQPDPNSPASKMLRRKPPIREENEE